MGKQLPIEKAIHAEPSVIILDNKLPGGFGLDFISYIQKKYSDIKIIMISGFASVRDVAVENGVDMFFENPFLLKMNFTCL